MTPCLNGTRPPSQKGQPLHLLSCRSTSSPSSVCSSSSFVSCTSTLAPSRRRRQGLPFSQPTPRSTVSLSSGLPPPLSALCLFRHSSDAHVSTLTRFNGFVGANARFLRLRLCPGPASTPSSPALPAVTQHPTSHLPGASKRPRTHHPPAVCPPPAVSESILVLRASLAASSVLGPGLEAFYFRPMRSFGCLVCRPDFFLCCVGGHTAIQAHVHAHLGYCSIV